MLEAVLFDVDGVLLDSEEIYFQSVSETFRRFGVEIGKEEYVKRWMIEQTTTAGAIKDYCLEVSIDEVRRIKTEIFQEKLPRVEMMPHAFELLLDLYGYYPLGAVTSSRNEELGLKLDKFDLRKYFSVVVSGDDVENVKPHKEPYERAVRLLGVNAGNTVVIEDNPSGVRSGKDAGCKVIAYPNGVTRDMDFCLVDRMVHSFREVDRGYLEGMI